MSQQSKRVEAALRVWQGTVGDYEERMWAVLNADDYRGQLQPDPHDDDPRDPGPTETEQPDDAPREQQMVWLRTHEAELTRHFRAAMAQAPRTA
jgi:hypothetical protein